MGLKEKPEMVYDDGRTKQSFAKQCDVNVILRRAQKAGTLSHLQKFEGQYGDFAGFDFFEAQTQIARAKVIFEELPGEVRREFGNDPSKFFEFANDDANVGKLAEILPSLAQPGRQFRQVIRTPGSEVAEEPAPVESPPVVDSEKAAEVE